MLDEQRPRHLPAARDFIRKRHPFLHPRVTAATAINGQVESLTGPVTITEISTISSATVSSSSRISSTVKSSATTTPTTVSVPTSSVSSTPSSSSSLSSTPSSVVPSTSAAQVSSTASPSASAVISSQSATATGSTASIIGAESTTRPGLSGGAVAAIAIGVLVLVAAAAVLIGRRCMVMRRQQKRATVRWLNGFTASSSEAFSGPDKFSAQPPMSVVNPSYGDGYAYTPTLNGTRIDTRGAVAGLAGPTTPAISYNNAPTTPGFTPQTALSSFVNRAVVRRTFIPNLPDELAILNGEMLDVLQEYDDGWALCSNSKGETGMVPLECLSSQSETGSDFWGERSMGGSRRVSSISGRV